MKLNFKHIALGLILTGSFAGTALAEGTDAGTSITNTATLTYKAGIADRTVVSSPDGNTPTGLATTFTVDRKLDVEVAGGGDIAVTPGATEQVATFTLTNNGNADQGVVLTWPDAGSDDFNVTNQQICIDDGDDVFEGTGTENCTTLSLLITTVDVDSLAEDGVLTIYLVGDVPATAGDGDEDLFLLSAQIGEEAVPVLGVVAITSDDSGTDKNANQTNLDDTLDLFADGDGDAAGSFDDELDGKHVADARFYVESAEIEVIKTAEVVWDPVSCSNTTPPTDAKDTVATICGTGSPKAIPGAYVRYTISLTNSGTAAATSAAVVDTVDTDTLIQTGSVDVTDDADGTIAGGFTDASSTTVVDVNTFTIAPAGDAGDDDVVLVRFFVEVQ